MVEEGEFLNRIHGLLKIYPRGLTISEISQRLKCNRNSVAKYLKILQISGTVEMHQMGAARVFFLSQFIPISGLLGFTKEGILVIANDGKIIQVNERFCRMFDLDVTSIIGISYLMLPTEILKAFHFDAYFDSDTETEYTAVVSYNKYDWCRFFKVKYIKTVFDDGRSGLTVIVEDVTLETEIEERLRISEARYRGIVEDQTELICRYGYDGTLSFANGAFCRLFQMNLNEILQHSLFDFLKPDAARQIIAGMRACSLFSPVFEIEFEFHLPSGSSRWYHWVSRMLTYDYGSILEFQGVGRDITERKNAERELLIKSQEMDSSIVPIALLSLKESLAFMVDQLEGTVNQMGDPTFIISRDRIVVAWNEAMETLTGLNKREMIGTHKYKELLKNTVPSLPILVDLFDLPTKELIQFFPQVSRVGNSFYTDAFVQTFHGEKGTYVWAKASPILDASGRVIGHIQTIKDMTNWRRAIESVA